MTVLMVLTCIGYVAVCLAAVWVIALSVWPEVQVVRQAVSRRRARRSTGRGPRADSGE